MRAAGPYCGALASSTGSRSVPCQLNNSQLSLEGAQVKLTHFRLDGLSDRQSGRFTPQSSAADIASGGVGVVLRAVGAAAAGVTAIRKHVSVQRRESSQRAAAAAKLIGIDGMSELLCHSAACHVILHISGRHLFINPPIPVSSVLLRNHILCC